MTVDVFAAALAEIAEIEAGLCAGPAGPLTAAELAVLEAFVARHPGGRAQRQVADLLAACDLGVAR